MTKRKCAIVICVLALMLCAGISALAQTTEVDGYVLDPNWYAWHPLLTSPQVFGMGKYEYAVGGHRAGDELYGLAANTESNLDNNYQGIHGYFRKPSMPSGDWNLATWSRWWRPATLFEAPYPWTLPSKPILRLHANMWSYGTAWPGYTQGTTLVIPSRGTWNEIGQTFVATGTSVTLIDIRSSLSGVSWTLTIHEGGRGGPQISPARTFNSPGGPSDVRIYYCGGDVPTVPGQTYYIRLKAAGITTGIFCESEPRPDLCDPMPNGCAYYDGIPDPYRDLGITICSDDDGIVTSLNTDKNGSYPGSVGAVGQTFRARGTGLLCFQFWGANQQTDYVATVYDGIDGMTPGAKIGFAKRNAYSRYGDPEVIFMWKPGECPLTPGHTYYIEVTRAGGGVIQFTGSTANLYPDGECYVNRSGGIGWDMAGCIMEEESEGSAQKPTVQIPHGPDMPAVALADRGTRTLTVRWTTDVPSDSTVDYGPWTGNYTDTYYSSALVTNHVATLTGLQPNTMYHYRVKSAANLYRPAVTRDCVTCTTNETPNLLLNPSFEEVPPPPNTHSRVIASPPWYYGGMDIKAADGQWFDGMPVYSGSWLCEGALNNSVCDSYVYQTVPAIPGVPYNFTLALTSWMHEDNKMKVNEWNQPGRVDYVKFGIDPTGGTDRKAATVQWSPIMYSQQHWTVGGTRAVAAANNITVFVSMMGVGGYGITWHNYGIDDCRLTGEYPTAIPIADLKGTTADGAVTVSDLIITATPAQVGAYYAETEARTQGIRIESTQTVALGARVTVSGSLSTDPNTHERSIKNAVFTSSVADAAPDSLFLKPLNVGGAAFGTLIPAVDGSVGPHNTGLLITVAGKVTQKAGDSTYVFINDGSLAGDGIKVDTSRLAAVDVPDVDEVVSVVGVSTLWLDGSTVKPMVAPRSAGDISIPYN